MLGVDSYRVEIEAKGKVNESISVSWRLFAANLLVMSF